MESRLVGLAWRSPTSKTLGRAPSVGVKPAAAPLEA